ncbi:MAG: RNA polymerase sigma factor [Acidobacteria bacterium]|nr:RNA polymerase sigma factor [Acidobacteriota bacterium]
MDLEDVLRTLAPRLVRYACGRVQDIGLGEEIAQDALTALVQRWHRHGPPESPEAFAFAIAKRRAWRASFKQRLLVPLTALAFHADRGLDPEARAIARVDGLVVRRAITSLPKLDREALLLVAAGEWSGAEAARLLGVSDAAFRMRISRARRRLAALLGGQDGTQH